jgi:membrane protease subunit (stomatin/prohibitin family)
MVVTEFTQALGELKIPVLDLASNYRALSKQLEEALDPHFAEYGLDLTKFLIENISVPPEVEAAMDKRASMGVVGVGDFATFQAANTMGQGGSSPAGDMAQMMAGMAIGQQMVAGMQANKPAPAAAAAPAPEKTVVERLKELKELHEAGILSDDEFNSKKTELVAQL